MARDELKVNIIIKDGHIFLGVQAAGCDPKMTTLKGDLQAAMELIPSFVEEANRLWDASPHNPKSSILEPVPAAPVRTATTASSVATKPTAPAKPAQPNFF
jgi:hypothetical protein